MEVVELRPADLYRRCDPDQFDFESTKDLEDFAGAVGQPRAVDALHFGTSIRRKGYNVFTMGYEGAGKRTLIQNVLESKAKDKAVPSDYCYVNNFQETRKPRTLKLPPGKGKELADDMERLVDDCQNAIKSAFESEEYQNRSQSITKEFQEEQQQAFDKLKEKAEEKGLTVMRTPGGLAFAPVRDGDIVPPDEFKKLPEEEQERLQKEVENLQKEAQKIFQKMPAGEREMNRKLRDLQRQFAEYAVRPLIDELRKKYGDLEQVIKYLDTVQKDMIEHIEDLRKEEERQKKQKQMMEQAGMPSAGTDTEKESPALQKYKVNVFLDRGDDEGAPLVYEENPTYQNLLGRMENIAHMGTLMTNFTMLRPGALHRANGGYLILDALKVLTTPLAWDGLKRALKSEQIRIESMGQMYGLISTVSLEPEPIPIDVKVVLMGPPILFYLLRAYDPEFSTLFKVTADFATEMDRTDQTANDYARLIAKVVHGEKLKDFDRTAIARVVEHGSRMVGDSEKLSVHMQRVTDLVREADYWAGENGKGTVKAADVQKAIDKWIYRSDRIRERMQEEIKRGTILIDTEGSSVGQVNGLSVIQLAEFAFGRPSRITARIHLGKGKVVDIEREVEMGGPIHSKGVLILAGFLGSRYAMDQPLSLSASLVFEQSYSGVEGDSASSAELYALLSAIGDVPIKQSLAVTGSVNQHGQVQPVGGINEKIEGFFDTCNEKGLTGDQGVLIPASNVKHLMVRQDVIDAVKDGKFHIYPVEWIDQGIEILTGVTAGKKDEQGRYPEDSVNGKVYGRLAEMTERWKKLSPSAEKEKME